MAFAVASGYSQGGPATTSEILDIGLPALSNISAHSVRLTGISLAGTSKTVHLRNVTAFRYGANGGLGLATGDMHICKGALPVTAVVTPPHAYSNWYVVMAVTFSKAGRYRINRVRISYITDGHSGWQYQNLFTTMFVKIVRPGTQRFVDPCQ